MLREHHPTYAILKSVIMSPPMPYCVLLVRGKKLAAKKCDGSMKYILSHRDDPVPT